MARLILLLFFCGIALFRVLTKQILLIATLLLITQCATANDTTLTFRLQKNVAGNYKNMELDNLGNTYLVTATNQILKLNNNFDSIASFNNSKSLGNITSIDVSNPLKILIFYKSFSTIVILDRYLSAINTINLQKQNLFGVSAVTSSYDNNIWLFDEVENKIKKIDNDGKLLNETVDFRILFDFDKSFTTDYLKDIEGKLYIYNKQNGLFCFDYYGALQHRFSIVALSNTQIETGNFIGFGKDGIQFYNIKNRKAINYNPNLNFTTISKFKFNKNLFYTLSKEGLNVYQLGERKLKIKG